MLESCHNPNDHANIDLMTMFKRSPEEYYDTLKNDAKKQA